MSEIAQVRSEVEALAQSLEALGVIQQQHSNKLGIAEKGILKFKVALKKNPISRVTMQMLEMAKGIGQVTKFTANNSVMSIKEREEAYKKMTIMQKLTTSYLMFGGVAKMNNKILQVANNRFTRLMTRVFSLVSIFLIVGFALAALSLAIDGTNSPVLTLTEDMGYLHDAMQGLALVISGEGDEGLAALFDVLAASILTAAVAFAIFSGPVALIIGAIVALIGIFQLVKNETGSFTAALLTAAGVGTTLAGVFLYLKATIATAMGTGATLISAGVATAMAGIGLVIAGVGGMVAYIMGAGEGLMGFLLGLGSAILIGVGLVIAGVAAIPAAIIAAIILLIATIIRYWDETKMIVASIGTFLFEWGATIFYGAIAGLALLFSTVVGIIGGAIGLIVGAVVGIFTALFEVGKSFYTDVIQGGTSLLDWFLSIPGTIKDGFVSGFKGVFNTIIGLYNDFAGFMEFDIPDWVPVVGGNTFSLPTIPELAKGGIVNSPTLAMIGEDGPEAVVPLSKRNNPDGIGLGGGGGITVNINVGGVTDRTDKKQLAKEIGDLIRAEMARGGRSYGNRRSAV